jgi:hypothetical protein
LQLPFSFEFVAAACFLGSVFDFALELVAAGSGSSNRAAVEVAFVASHFSAPSAARRQPISLQQPPLRTPNAFFWKTVNPEAPN